MDGDALYSIGDLARRTGLAVRTIRLGAVAARGRRGAIPGPYFLSSASSSQYSPTTAGTDPNAPAKCSASGISVFSAA